MIISQVLAWCSLLLCVMEILRFPVRKSGNAKLNRFFHAHHIPFGVLLLITGIVHGVLAGNSDSAAELSLAPVLFTVNWGTACYICAVLLGITYLLRKKLKRKWMTAHRVLTVIMAVILALHIIEVGVGLPQRIFGKPDNEVQSTNTLPDGTSAPEIPSEKPEDDNTVPSASEKPEDDVQPSASEMPEEDISPSASEEPEDAGGSADTGLADGVYEGSGEGRNGAITVSVTVEGGQITDIEVISNNETPKYYARAEAVIDMILDDQTTEVDSIAGATISSDGIRSAVANALEQAK